jgi:hypothetical protein
MMPSREAQRTYQQAIHLTSWKGNSANFVCRIVHRSPVRAARVASAGHHAAWVRSTVVVGDEDARKRILPAGYLIQIDMPELAKPKIPNVWKVGLVDT